MKLKFEPIKMWGAAAGNFTFTISHEVRDNRGNYHYVASSKTGIKPLRMIGSYETFEEAVAACEVVAFMKK